MDHREVSAHYTVSDLGNRILAALERDGKDLDSLTVDDLGPVDAFHIRGRGATEELARWADLRPEHTVLDVGSGVGGTARYLAATVGCRVVGLDLTEDYCRVAEMLSARVGLTDRTEFRQGSGLAIPFEDQSFDIVWTEHVQMNIADKALFYRELARVCKADGRLAFHDIFAGNRAGVHYPVPWASDESISHLVTVETLEALLSASGFAPLRWEDKSEASADYFRERLRQADSAGQPIANLSLLMGDTAGQKFRNVLRNLEEGRLQVVQAVMKRLS